MWTLYQIGMLLLVALAAPRLLTSKGRHYLRTLRGRLVRTDPQPATHDVWIHAVSVGEVGVAQTLLGAMPTEVSVLLTTITPTGQDLARKGLAKRATVAYLPVDLARPIRRFLAQYDPRSLVLVEGEYWPLLLSLLRRRGTPRILINGRISDRSFRRLRIFAAPARRLLFDPVDHFGMQSPEDARRLRDLGVADEKITVTGNLKYETPEPRRLPELEALVLEVAAGRPLLLAGSTMPGEEALVAKAFAQCGGGERALLVLAPRHPERFDAVAEELGQTLETVRRSALESTSLPTPPDCLLLDTLGELASLYRVADGCFIGGTLVPTGGHNPLEAARFGKPVVVGPSMENFREMAEHFDQAEAWARVQGPDELGETFAAWLRDPESATALGQRAQRLIDGNRGALARTLELLQPLWSPAAGGKT